MHRLFSARCLILGTVLVASVRVPGQTDKPNAAPVEALIKYGLCSRSGGPDQGYGCAAKKLTQEVEGRTPLLPTGPPYRHQHGLRPRACPGPAASPDFPQDDPEADRQLRTPVGGVQARLDGSPSCGSAWPG